MDANANKATGTLHRPFTHESAHTCGASWQSIKDALCTSQTWVGFGILTALFFLRRTTYQAAPARQICVGPFVISGWLISKCARNETYVALSFRGKAVVGLLYVPTDDVLLDTEEQQVGMDARGTFCRLPVCQRLGPSLAWVVLKLVMDAGKIASFV